MALMASSPRRSDRFQPLPPEPAKPGAEVDSGTVLANSHRPEDEFRPGVQEAARSWETQEGLEREAAGSVSLVEAAIDISVKAAGFLEERFEKVPECSQLPAGKCPMPAEATQGVEAIVDGPCHRLPPSSGVNVPSESTADLLEVYSFLRSFSQILFLSPFSLPEFVCSLCLKEANALIDAVHVSLLQMLRRHLDRVSKEECHPASVCLRIFDWDFLDVVTWPSYMMAFLATHGVNKQGGYATVRSGLLEGEYYQLDVTKKIVILKILCDNVLEADETKAELEMRVNLLDYGADFLEAKSLYKRFRDPVSGRWCTDQRRRGNVSLDKDMLIMGKPIHHKRETFTKGWTAEHEPQLTSLPGGETEVPSMEDRSTEARDTNYDECVLCGMDGSLICCDGCPAAYHSRCVGVAKGLLPEGDWFCPECMIETTGSKPKKACKVIRGAEVLGVDPHGRLYTAVYGYLLVSDSYWSTRECHLYDTSDLPRLLMFFQERGPSYDATRCFVLQWWADIDGPASLDSVGGARVTEESDITRGCNIPAALYFPAVNASQLVPSIQTAGNFIQESWGESTRSACLTSLQDVNSGMRSYHFRSMEARNSEPTAAVVELEKDFGDTTSATLEGKQAGGDVGGIGKLSVALTLKRDSLGRFKSPRLHDFLLGSHSGPYNNQYALGESAAFAAASLAVCTGFDGTAENAGARKRSKGLNAADQVKAFSQAPAQFYWPHSRKKLVESRKERCGWCIPCRSSSRRGCLLNIVAGNLSVGVALVPGGIRPTKSGQNHLPALVAYVLYMEETLDPLLTGPWECSDYRKQWRKKIEVAESCNVLKAAIMQMESRLRLVALSTDWTKQAEDAPPRFSWSGNSHNSETITSKRGRTGRYGGVNAWKSKFSSCANPDFGFYWRRGGKLSRQLIRWERLPSSSARRVGRQGGLKEVPELIYTEDQETARRTLRCAWQARLEMAMNVSQLAVQVRQLDKHIRWSDLAATEACQRSGDDSLKKVVVESKSVEGGALMYLLQIRREGEEGLQSAKKKDVKTTINAGETANSGAGLPTLQTRDNGSCDDWTSEREVPLYLLKDFEARARARRQTKLNKPSRRGQVKSAKTLRKGAFWARICAPLPPEAPKQNGICLSRYERRKAATLISRRKLLIPDRQLTHCQVCGATSDQGSMPGALTARADNKETICNNCLQLRLGKRRRKPSYKMLQLLDSVGLVCSKTSGNEVRDFTGAQSPPIGRGSTLDVVNLSIIPVSKDSRRMHTSSGQTELVQNQERLLFGPDDPAGQINMSCSALNGLTVMDDLSSEGNLTAEQQVFRRQRIMFPGQLRCDPRMGPRCYVCWQEYNPTLIYVGCSFCHEWFHGDALGLTEEHVAGLVGFKCCKCRKVCSPACPQGQSIRRQRSTKHRARVNLDPEEGFCMKWSDGGAGCERMGNNTCAICASQEVCSDMTCRICGVHTHAKCYFLRDSHVPTHSDWACDACNAGITPGCGSCCLCPLKGGALKQTVDGLWIHSVCGLWNQANISDSAELFGSISSILMRRKNMECCFCKKKDGACIKCSAPGCRNKYFHPLCCRKADLPILAEYNGSVFVAYCQRHAGLTAKY